MDEHRSPASPPAPSFEQEVDARTLALLRRVGRAGLPYLAAVLFPFGVAATFLAFEFDNLPLMLLLGVVSGLMTLPFRGRSKGWIVWFVLSPLVLGLVLTVLAFVVGGAFLVWLGAAGCCGR